MSKLMQDFLEVIGWISLGIAIIIVLFLISKGLFNF